MIIDPDLTKKGKAIYRPSLSFGAGNEIRTRDPNLGKVVLYQLSYSRAGSVLYVCVCLCQARVFALLRSRRWIGPAMPPASS